MLQDELGITKVQYQNRALACVCAYLKSFSPSSKFYELKTVQENEIPISIRVQENPPSVQIRQAPRGGQLAGLARIKEKLSLPEDVEIVGELVVPKIKILLAQENDLTRECIIITLADNTLTTLLLHDLIAPEPIAKLLMGMRDGRQDYFIVAQRYLLGLEQEYGLSIPYRVVAADDEMTFQYLEKLLETSSWRTYSR